MSVSFLSAIYCSPRGKKLSGVIRFVNRAKPRIHAVFLPALSWSCRYSLALDNMRMPVIDRDRRIGNEVAENPGPKSRSRERNEIPVPGIWARGGPAPLAGRGTFRVVRRRPDTAVSLLGFAAGRRNR